MNFGLPWLIKIIAVWDPGRKVRWRQVCPLGFPGRLSGDEPVLLAEQTQRRGEEAYR